MIPKTPHETRKNADTTINDRLEKINGFRKTLYIGLGVMALAFGAQKCADTLQYKGLEKRVQTTESHVRTYDNRIEQNYNATQQQSDAIKQIREDGFYIADPCYDPDSAYRINVNPCTTKTE